MADGRAHVTQRQCADLPYMGRLIHLNLPTLICRCIRGDMITVYKNKMHKSSR